VCADAGDESRRAVGVEADDDRAVGTKDAADLLRDGREYLGRRQPSGDQRGDPAQRGLLFGEPAKFVAALLELGAALGVRDRGTDELGEAGQALLGFGRQVLAPRPDADRAPPTPLNHDRNRDAGPDTQAADGGVNERARGPAEVVAASRTAGAQGDRQGQRRLRFPAASDRHLVGVIADEGEDGHRAVGIEAGDGRRVGPENVSDLVRDRREDLGRWHSAGDERGDPAQRGLFLCEAAQLAAAFLELGAALGVRDRGGDELGEADNALFGVGRKTLTPRPDGDRAPQTPLNHDRNRDTGPDS
jgi:hypothetical protein